MKNYNFHTSETKFAPAPRDSFEKVRILRKEIERAEFLSKAFSKIPLLFMILNIKRQVIYSNELLVKSLGYENQDEITGYRPGEVFRCIHADDEEGGCGTSEHCIYCGAVQAVLESDKKDCMVTKEARLITYSGNETVANEFEVSSKPFYWKKRRFFLVSLNDISNLKRRESLERVFYHDIINKAGSLQGLVNLINFENVPEIQEIVSIIKRGTKELIRDIMFQKTLSLAEKGELIVSPAWLSSQEIMENIREDFRIYSAEFKKHVVIDPACTNISFESDFVLIGRILSNLVKNALEASGEGDKVTLSAACEGESVIFSVHNKQAMPKNVEMQMFQRSFSTKGEGRGTGTYSVKLFAESYLRGKVSFETGKDTGTVFYVILPLKFGK